MPDSNAHRQPDEQLLNELRPVLGMALALLDQTRENGQADATRASAELARLARPAIARMRTGKIFNRIDRIDDLPETLRKQVVERVRILGAWELVMLEAIRSGRTRDDATRAFIAVHGVPRTTLFRWHRLFKTFGLAGLIDQRKFTPAHAPSKGRRGRRSGGSRRRRSGRRTRPSVR